MPVKRLIMAVPVVLILMSILVACGYGADHNSDTQTERKVYTYDRVTGAADAKEEKDIYMITKVADSDYWLSIQRAAKQAADEVGYNLYYGATENEADVEGQRQLIEDAVKAGADAIILAPLDSDALVPDVQKVKEQDIPVILIDTILNTKEYDVCYMTDNMQAGRLAAQKLRQLLLNECVSDAEEIEIAIQIGSANSQTIIDRLAGFLEYWADYAPVNWKVSDDVYVNNGDVEDAAAHAAQCLESEQNLKAMVGLNNGSSQGIAQSIIDHKRTDIMMVGFDYSDQMKALVTSPDYDAATVVQNQHDMGYEAVMAAVEIRQGNTPAYKFVDTGVNVIDIDNLEEEEIQRSLAQ